MPRCGALSFLQKTLHYKRGWRGAQAIVRGGARCALHVHGRGARADACGRSFAVLSTQVYTAGLRLRLVVPRPMPAAIVRGVVDAGFNSRLAPRLTCGSMLEVSRDAVAAGEGEGQVVSCSAEQSKYCSIYTVALGPCGDLPFTSWVVGSVFAAALAV